MKKKSWISGLGWLALMAWLGAVLCAFIVATFHDADARQTAGGFLTLALLVGGPATFIWIFASIVDAFMRRQASLQGAALAQALGREAPAAASWPAAARPAPVDPLMVPGCAVCRQYLAEFVCNAHNLPLCSQCAGPHTQTSEGCTLRGLHAMATAPAPRPRAVNTSPLAGMR